MGRGGRSPREKASVESSRDGGGGKTAELFSYKEEEED